MARIKGIIFDIDGTLLDSNDAHAQSWVDIFAVHGYDLSFPQVRSLIGMGGDKLLPRAIGVEKDSPLGKRMEEERLARFKEHFLPNLFPFRGARELLDRLHSDRVKVIIATSAKEEEAVTYLNIIGVVQDVDVLATSSDASNSKPAPDIVEAALKKSGLRPEDVVMVGDTPYDVEAAARSDVRTIAVTCGGWEADALKDAWRIRKGPDELLAEYEELVTIPEAEA